MPRKPQGPPPPQPPSIPPGEGIELLREQIARGKTLLGNRASTEDDFQNWRRTTNQILAEALGEDHALRSTAVAAGSQRQVLTEEEDVVEMLREQVNRQLKALEPCIEHLERELRRKAAASSSVERPQVVTVVADPLKKVLGRLHRVALQMRRRHDGRPTLEVSDEYDVQDLLQALLAIDFEDVRPEEHTPSYAGKSTRMDFLLKPEQTVIEVKYAKSSHAEKEIGTELIEDIARYRTHQDCKRLVCFVYDPAHAIRNAAGLEHDLSGTREGLVIEVIVAPKP